VVSSTPLNDTMNGGSNSTMPPARVGVQDLFQRLRYPGGIAGPGGSMDLDLRKLRYFVAVAASFLVHT
jgi:hypothetical protein